MTPPLYIAIIVGSTRPGRRAEPVARWVMDAAAGHAGANFEIVDLLDHALPLLDEPIPARAGRYAGEHTRRWAATIAGYDGFVFVSPEYNHALPGALKNAIDFIYAEWADKAAGIVTYGADGGVRAAEQLRLVLGELKIADVRTGVALSLFDDWHDYRSPDTVFTPRPRHDDALDGMLAELLAWARALRPVRTSPA